MPPRHTVFPVPTPQSLRRRQPVHILERGWSPGLFLIAPRPQAPSTGLRGQPLCSQPPGPADHRATMCVVRRDPLGRVHLLCHARWRSFHVSEMLLQQLQTSPLIRHRARVAHLGQGGRQELPGNLKRVKGTRDLSRYRQCWKQCSLMINKWTRSEDLN